MWKFNGEKQADGYIHLFKNIKTRYDDKKTFIIYRV